MLKITDLFAGYDKKEVLFGIDATIEKGKITAIIGANGSGKSTFLKAASGIIAPFSGEITIDGIPLKKLSRKDIAKKIAFLRQGTTVPQMTVGELVLHGRYPYCSYPCRYSDKDKETALCAMKAMNIDSLTNTPMSSLSGGMQQAAYIAMILCGDSDYILMDEPTTYLDISNSLRLINMLSRLSDSGKGIGLILHDLILALEHSHNMIVMKDGKVIASDTTENIYLSGVIGEAMGVDIKRIQSENGYSYNYTEPSKSNLLQKKGDKNV